MEQFAYGLWVFITRDACACSWSSSPPIPRFVTGTVTPQVFLWSWNDGQADCRIMPPSHAHVEPILSRNSAGCYGRRPAETSMSADYAWHGKYRPGLLCFMSSRRVAGPQPAESRGVPQHFVIFEGCAPCAVSSKGIDPSERIRLFHALAIRSSAN